MTKVIFLDFDGVLNSGDNAEILMKLAPYNPEFLQRYIPGTMFDERCVRWLDYVVRKSGCKIVISSSWRLQYELEELQEIWKNNEFPGEIIDYTPFDVNLSFTSDGKLNRDCERGREIQMWLDSHKISRYCIIDDEFDMLPGQVFVQTDPEFGLTAETAKLALEYLNS